VVEFLIHERDSDAKIAGYLPIALYGGLFVGRLLLADVMHRFGERRMAAGCIFLCIVFQLLFWLVPNLPTNGVALVFIGFFSGPLFATVCFPPL
jgi:fucose permease